MIDKLRTLYLFTVAFLIVASIGCFLYAYSLSKDAELIEKDIIKKKQSIEKKLDKIIDNMKKNK